MICTVVYVWDISALYMIAWFMKKPISTPATASKSAAILLVLIFLIIFGVATIPMNAPGSENIWINTISPSGLLAVALWLA